MVVMSMTFDEMFTDQEAGTFIERRDEVVSLVRAATDLLAAERGLQPFVDRLSVASDEREFNDAFEQVADRLAVTRAAELTRPDRPVGDQVSPRQHDHTMRARRGIRSARKANSSRQLLAHN